MHTVGEKNVPEPFEGGSAVLPPDEHPARADIFRPDHNGCVLSPNLPESLTTVFEGYVNRASEPRFYRPQPLLFSIKLPVDLAIVLPAEASFLLPLFLIQ